MSGLLLLPEDDIGDAAPDNADAPGGIDPALPWIIARNSPRPRAGGNPLADRLGGAIYALATGADRNEVHPDLRPFMDALATPNASPGGQAQGLLGSLDQLRSLDTPSANPEQPAPASDLSEGAEAGVGLTQEGRPADADDPTPIDEVVVTAQPPVGLAAPPKADAPVLDTRMPEVGFTPAPPTSSSDLQKGVAKLLDRISMGEGTDDARAAQHGFATGYDVPLAFGRLGMPPKPLTQMTLGEIKAYQRQILNNRQNHMNSSAVGRYQIVGKTLRGLQSNLNLDDSTLYTPAIQDRLAQQILLENGFHAYRHGLINPSQFQEKVARQWASVAHPGTGRATQGLGTTTQQFQAAISDLR